MKTPCIKYKESKIEYESGLVEFEYPKNYKSRNVNNRGFLNYKGKKYFVGNPFNGYNMGLYIDKSSQINCWFGNNLLGHFDKESLLLVPEKNDIFKPRKKEKCYRCLDAIVLLMSVGWTNQRINKMNIELKFKITKIYLWTVGIFLFFWWPLSHWFYPDFYHQLLGFEIGSYQDSMVKIIGTTGIIPVMLIFFSAINPKRNRHMIISLIIFSILMACTYIYLIITNKFPKLEIINVGLSLFSALFLILFYPWGVNEEK